MKITRIEVCDFRGFPGPAVYDFDFGDANNLLIYGENGSGKSSLFRALQEFFKPGSPRGFEEFRNIDPPVGTSGHVAVHFDSGAVQTVQTWGYGQPRPVAPPASQTALRTGCLDYRSLLETNFTQRGKTVNLFDIAVQHLLANREAPIAGGRSARIGTLWNRVLKAKPPSHHKRYLRECQEALDIFNGAFRGVIGPLVDKASELLSRFPGCDYELGLAFQGVEYPNGWVREFKNRELILSIRRDGQLLEDHHNFLNEARLSAIGLVIYLAGLLTSVPPVSDYPKVLVLDDVLIGLDTANRIPVMDVIAEFFGDWQVILLTHDLTWYEMVRQDIAATGSWTAYELRVSTDGRPIHRRDGDQSGVEFYLSRARRHLGDGDFRAAGTYARAGFEWKLKKYCERHHLAVPYSREPRKITAESFWRAAREHALRVVSQRTPPDPAAAAKLSTRLQQVEAIRSIMLNPLSHSGTPTLERVEVERAIRALTELELPSK